MSTPPDEFQIWRMDGESITPAPDALPADLVAYLRAEHDRQNPPREKAASEPALLPCHRCGDTSANVIAIDAGFRPVCGAEGCHMVGAWRATRQQAIDWWNTRAAPAELVELRAAVVEFLSARDGYLMSSGQPPSDSEYDTAERALRQLIA